MGSIDMEIATKGQRLANEQDTDTGYTYVYRPGLSAEINVACSMAMDRIRDRLSRQRTEEMLTARFRERGTAGPGPVPESESGEEVER